MISFKNCSLLYSLLIIVIIAFTNETNFSIFILFLVFNEKHIYNPIYSQLIETDI